MTRELRVERVLDAAPEAVFDAFTDPDAQWEMYADAPDWVVRSECDLRVGGLHPAGPEEEPEAQPDAIRPGGFSVADPSRCG